MTGYTRRAALAGAAAALAPLVGCSAREESEVVTADEWNSEPEKQTSTASSAPDRDGSVYWSEARSGGEGQ